MRGGRSQKKSKLPSGTTNKNSVDEGNAAGSPAATATTTQLRHQSYVGRRPGAYREGPGGESVLASGPTALVEAVTTSYQHQQPPNEEPPPRRQLEPSSDVLLLEAEPVWEAEPVLSVIVANDDAAAGVDVPVTASPKPTSDEDDVDANPTRLPQPQRQRRRRCMMTRRTVVILLVITIVAIVVAAVVAGVIVATSKGSNRTNKDPSVTGSIGDGGGTPSSSAGSFPPAGAPANTGTGLHTPSPTTLQQQCPDEYSAFANCITSSGQSTSSCGSCINTYLPNPISTCEESAYYTCYVIVLCNYQCGPCTTQYAAISNCMNQGKCPTITC